MDLFTSWKRRSVENQAKEQAKARSDEIDLDLKKERKSFKHDVLLISIPEYEAAGFDLVRRMRIEHHAAFTYEELANFRRVIREILLQNSRNIVIAILSRNLGPTCRSNEANCEYIMNYTDSPESSSLPKFGRAVQDLWVDEIIPMLLDYPSRLTVDDNAAYFFTEVLRITVEEYVPSIEDIRHTTERGIIETCFNMVKSSSIRVLQVCDCHGQEYERRKWIHVFEGVISILFYASLSDYDKWVVGLDKRTRLHESFILFDAVINSRWFCRTSVILLLTDKAEFGTKLHKVPLAQYFPEYLGGTDLNECADYILRRFKSGFKSGKRQLYAHVTEARDPRIIIRLLFSSVNDAFLQRALEDLDLI